MGFGQRILVTGGTGYIGSHACVALLRAGFEVVVVDNLSNSHRSVVAHIAALGARPLRFVDADVRDIAALRAVFADTPIDAVIHFAGLKAVGESTAAPLRYYDNNVQGTLCLCQAMAEANVRTLIFSSSATVYGRAETLPLHEGCALGASNPYGWSKIMVEQILTDLHAADPMWRIGNLRYFNPVGAHESGLIGEDPRGLPNNLMPYICQVAAGGLPRLTVFGDDYPTPDGTGVRDYIHVVDLVEGHIAALRYLFAHEGLMTVNLGTGRGTSVLELVHAFAAASGRPVPYVIGPRRPGDIAACWADVTRAQDLLQWRARFDITAMCRDAWRWTERHESGSNPS
ncbi:MAG: UDP-glucose 4-epimerase GalE [Acidiferrobacter sp.]